MDPTNLSDAVLIHQGWQDCVVWCAVIACVAVCFCVMVKRAMHLPLPTNWAGLLAACGKPQQWETKNVATPPAVSDGS